MKTDGGYSDKKFMESLKIHGNTESPIPPPVYENYNYFSVDTHKL